MLLRGRGGCGVVWAQGLGALVLAGCAVGPNFRQPQPAMPSGWAGPLSPATSPATAPATAPASQASVTLAQASPVVEWWTTFQDPVLTSLISQAVISNLDVQVAQARILQARAQRSIAVADLLPSITNSENYRRAQTGTALAGGSAARSGSSSSAGAAAAVLSSLLNRTGTGAGTGTGTAASAAAAAIPSTPLHAVPHSAWQAGFDATWELDVFGGIRRNIEASTADLQAAVETRRNVLISVMSEVALNYISLRGFQREIAIAEENLRAQEQSAELTQRRYRGGFVSRLDVANAEAQVAATRSTIPTLQTQARQTIYNLGVLLGRDPGALVPELSEATPIPLPPPEVPVGLPSQLLRRRPDVRAAEAQLHAATARIGVATAQLFPQFALTGSFGWQSSQLKSLLNWDHNLWSFGPGMTWPIFEGGRLRAQVRLQNAVQQEALLVYEQTVLVAIQDVENALVAYAREQERRGALDDAVTANRQAVDLSMRLYTQGEIEFLNVLDAQRRLYASQDALVQSERTVATNLVALYKALGGGWEIAPDSDVDPKAAAAPRAVRIAAPATQRSPVRG